MKKLIIILTILLVSIALNAQNQQSIYLLSSIMSNNAIQNGYTSVYLNGWYGSLRTKKSDKDIIQFPVKAGHTYEIGLKSNGDVTVELLNGVTIQGDMSWIKITPSSDGLCVLTIKGDGDYSVVLQYTSL